jgi:hypothetical protein
MVELVSPSPLPPIPLTPGGGGGDGRRTVDCRPSYVHAALKSCLCAQSLVRYEYISYKLYI